MTLKELLKARGYTRKEFAAVVGTTERTINAYVYGTRRPSPEVAQRIATILDLTREEMWKMFYTTDAG